MEATQLLETEERELIEDPITGVWLDPDTGEIVDVMDKPEDGLEDAESLAMWLGEALTDARAHLAGLQAERQLWLDRVAEQFDADIRRAEQKIAWLTHRPDWLKRLKALHEERANGKPSCKFGMLKTRVKKSRESLEALNVEQALGWARENVPEAIRTIESLLVSHIPAEVRQTLPGPEECGLRWHPAGESTTFEVE